jgi:Domain of unknown function (DUF4350)/Domain of unknown function (DUF4129)
MSNVQTQPSVPPSGSGTPVETAKSVLAGDAYSFCKNKYYPLSDDEVKWCPLVGDQSDLCPTLPAACKRGPTLFGLHPHGHGEAEPPPEEWHMKLPHLGAFGSVLFWSLAVVAVGALIYAIAKNMTRWKPALKADPDAPAPESPHSDAAQKALETDVARLLARARRALSEGRLLDATAAAHAALLRQLEGEHLIRVHPSSTNGDYVRDLVSHASLRGAVRNIVSDVERLQFSDESPTQGLVESVIERVTVVIRSRAPAPRVGALGLVSMLLLAVLFVSCDRLGRGSWEYTPSGNAAVIELLARSGFETRVRLQSFAHLPDAGTELILLPEAVIDPPTWQKLLDWVDSGGTLVTTGQSPNLRTAPGVDLVDQKGAGSEARVAEAYVEGLGDLRVAIPGERALHLTHGSFGANECLTSGCDSEDDAEVHRLLTRGDSTYAAEFDLGNGRLLVFADDRLFVNASLAVPGNAAFLVALVEEGMPVVDGSGPKRVEIAGELVGVSSPNPISSVKRSKLWPVMLQLLLLLGLLFLAKGIPFGALRDPVRTSRRTFADHVRAMGISYKKSNAARHAAMLYATFALERLRERAKLGQSRGISVLADAIAVRSQQPIGQVARLLVLAEEARDPAEEQGMKTPREEHLALIRELSALLKRVGGGTR